MKDERVTALARWAGTTDLQIPSDSLLVPASDDASFRRYFRFDTGVPGVVFVDAPPEHEDNESFVKVASALAEGGLNCPRVLHVDFDAGFMAITDLGNRVYLDEMLARPERVGELYADAVSALTRMLDVECALPPYDEERLRAEMALFEEWFLPEQLGMHISPVVKRMLDDVCTLLVDNALAQPQRFVHRDYHCRNLMVTESNSPGIIDFQDAVTGPVTYDLVSLYKDCYYRFDRREVERQVAAFKTTLAGKGMVDPGDPLLRWFDLMGAQRHLKCAGIFSRLNLRDGKPRYLGDIPLVITYLVEVGRLYPELNDFADWLQAEIVPRMSEPPFLRNA